MKIISWNINGIRAVAKKGLADFLRSVQPDILFLQEIKISDSARMEHEFDFAGYAEYWNSAERPGYSGTAILVKQGFKDFIGVVNGLGDKEFDREGRVQILETSKYYFVNAYFPNSNSELSRLDYKSAFNEALLKRLQSLAKKKPVILGGDYNVAHQPIDLARPKQNEGNAGYTIKERSWMDKFLKAGFTDTFRYLNPEKIAYSWWSFRMNARARNVGWRIDYFCVSDKLRKSLKKAYILDKISGSDHAPVVIEL